MCTAGTVQLEHLPEVWHERTPPSADGLAAEILEHEAQFIRDALERHGWHREATARGLGIHKNALGPDHPGARVGGRVGGGAAALAAGDLARRLQLSRSRLLLTSIMSGPPICRSISRAM